MSEQATGARQADGELESQLAHALELLHGGDAAGAQAGFERMLARQPRHADAWHLLGMARRAQGDPAGAVDAIGRAIAVCADNPHFHSNLGGAYLAAGQAGAACDCFRRAIALAPAVATFHYNLGVALQGAGRHDDAVGSFEQALARDPDLVDAHNNRANALLALGRHDEALRSVGRAIALAPGVAHLYLNRAAAQVCLGRPAAALDDLERAIALEPSLLAARIQRAALLHDARRLADALQEHERIVALAPERADVYYHLALTVYRMGQFALAAQLFGQAVRRDPGNALYAMHQGVALLMQGDFAAGLPLLEARLGLPGAMATPFAQARWDGTQALAGRTLLVVAEQGLGDTLQFCRFLAPLRARGARVVLAAQPGLRALMQTVDGADAVVAFGELVPATDYYCYLMSLPLLLGTALAAVPARVPYLAGPLPAPPRPAGAVPPGRGALRIGVVWSGDPVHKNDASRSIALAQFARALPAGHRYTVLQPVIRPADQAALAARPDLLQVAQVQGSFSDTAAVCSVLDLVVCVDTSVAHLAGALGMPTWLLLPWVPDWRWQAQGEASYWYPTMRLYRQARDGEWAAPLQRLHADLVRYLQEPAAGPGAEPA